MRTIVALLVIVTTAACSVQAPGPLPQGETTRVSAVDPYRADIEKFRHDREAKLTSDTGWLTIAGLSFLTKPDTTVGSDAASDVVLPASAPARKIPTRPPLI